MMVADVASPAAAETAAAATATTMMVAKPTDDTKDRRRCCRRSRGIGSIIIVIVPRRRLSFDFFFLLFCWRRILGVCWFRRAHIARTGGRRVGGKHRGRKSLRPQLDEASCGGRQWICCCRARVWSQHKRGLIAGVRRCCHAT
jgi:hypothetical protein